MPMALVVAGGALAALLATVLLTRVAGAAQAALSTAVVLGELGHAAPGAWDPWPRSEPS